jgi:cysteine desulfurase family protein
MGIYMNNAATSWPKPEEVPKAMYQFMTSSGANLARGSSSSRDLETLDLVTTTRERLASFFGGYKDEDPRYVTFTSNVTEALNVVLKGFLWPSSRVVTTSMEHNAVMRPLRRLESERGVKVTVSPCFSDGTLDLERFEQALKEGQDLAVMSHCSNVCGTIQPIEEVSKLCRQYGVPLVLDSAQTAGVLDISARDLGLAALCFTGHKGLMGPQGTGGIVWEPSFAERVKPLVEGGTGSLSHLQVQPESLPDKFEAGTPNLPGIAGLSAALEWIRKTGLETIREKEKKLGEFLLEAILDMKKLTLYGKKTMQGRLSVFAVNPQDGDNATLALKLADEYGIEARPGLHCAPVAHETLGSFPQGALRLSVGYFNTKEEISTVIKALKTLV